MRVTCSETRYENVAALKIENDAIEAIVVPSIGAKIISLRDRRSGHEYLFRHPRRSLRQPAYAGLYHHYDVSGWDECFPGIGECYYPEEPWRGVAVPDHGELWTLPWQSEFADGVLRQWTYGVRFPYRFERAIDWSGGETLQFSYTVTNQAPIPFPAYWSTHPMLAATPTQRVILPDGIRVRVDSSRGARLGSLLSEHSWPVTRDHSGETVDLSQLGPTNVPWTDKVFSTRLPFGWAALFDEETEDYLAYTFNPAEIPYVGLAVIRGEWPEAGPPVHVVVLEPCTGGPDRVDLAIVRGEHQIVPANGTLSWRFAVHLGQGRKALENLGIPTH